MKIEKESNTENKGERGERDGMLSLQENALTPDDGFLIHEVIDHLYAVSQLKLRLF